MTDLTTSRSTAWLCLTYRVGWEIVVVHISLGCDILIQTVNLLNFGKRCKGYHIADLSLSTGKHGRTMHTGNQVNLGCQRTDLINGTSIRTLVIL